MLTCGTNRPDPDSYMMAMLGVQALGLQSVAVDCPEALKECHPLLSYLYSRDRAVVEAAKARLTMVDETVTSMVDETKSGITAVSGVLSRNSIWDLILKKISNYFVSFTLFFVWNHCVACLLLLVVQWDFFLLTERRGGDFCWFILKFWLDFKI